ncbi:Hemin uptake protein hemP [Pirellulimonas nuda]|uniref:Hemin uptake protein hemP n=1 Tax=Pirellulimonas nuda TaxID=2528009 RepID=A0A518D678_9BACT|nr:hemin uptake protein HemP [Pirellulimonas nuda]QDU86974.1 Hemin uptake protein hemP [Pirellulimonas nuda]
MDHQDKPAPAQTTAAQTTAAQTTAAQPLPCQAPQERVLPSQEIFQGERVVTITHAGERYRLLVTKNDKLILQK